MIYMAITRSQKEVIICGQHDHLMAAVKHEKAADRRKIGLPKRLAQM
jgi:ATP-dependent exoDNAse (exonuclease V) alpha subunit